MYVLRVVRREDSSNFFASNSNSKKIHVLTFLHELFGQNLKNAQKVRDFAIHASASFCFCSLSLSLADRYIQKTNNTKRFYLNNHLQQIVSVSTTLAFWVASKGLNFIVLSFIFLSFIFAVFASTQSIAFTLRFGFD